MTSVVKISAHCSDNKFVRVTLSDGDQVKETVELKNGESVEKYIYDNLAVSVCEVTVEGTAPPTA